MQVTHHKYEHHLDRVSDGDSRHTDEEATATTGQSDDTTTGAITTNYNTIITHTPIHSVTIAASSAIERTNVRRRIKGNLVLIAVRPGTSNQNVM